MLCIPPKKQKSIKEKLIVPFSLTLLNKNLSRTYISMEVSIEIKNLQTEYVRHRKYEKTLIYLRDYNGPGRIIINQ